MIDIETKSKIKDTVTEIDNFLKEIEKWIITEEKADNFFSETIQKIYNTIPKNSDEYNLFDRWKIENIWLTIWHRNLLEPKYIDEYPRLESLITRLSELISHKVIEDEIFFTKDDTYRATRHLQRCFSSAKNEILIIDNYIDWNIFDFIDEIDVKIRVMILTKREGVKKLFKTLYNAYDWKNLTVKITNRNNHDRYIIIDQKNMYLLWTSINWIGKKDFSFKKLTSKDQITHLYSLYEEWELLDV